jgi:hypothetical protein
VRQATVLHMSLNTLQRSLHRGERLLVPLPTENIHRRYCTAQISNVKQGNTVVARSHASIYSTRRCNHCEFHGRSPPPTVAWRFGFSGVLVARKPKDRRCYCKIPYGSEDSDFKCRRDLEFRYQKQMRQVSDLMRTKLFADTNPDANP